MDQSLGDPTAPESTPDLQGRTRTTYSTVTALVMRKEALGKAPWCSVLFATLGNRQTSLLDIQPHIQNTESVGEESKKVLECVNLEGLQSSQS